MKDNFGLNEDEYERFIELYSKIVRKNPEKFGEIREMTEDEKEDDSLDGYEKLYGLSNDAK
jgi:hypothetical protein